VILRLVADVFDWLAVARGDQAAPDSVAAIRRNVDLAIAQRPAGQRPGLLTPASRAAVLPTVIGVLVEVVWWLDTCDDDVVDPDLAVKILEGVAAGLLGLPDAHRARLLEVLTRLADADGDDDRRERLSVFPYAMGLVEAPSFGTQAGGPGQTPEQRQAGQRREQDDQDGGRGGETHAGPVEADRGVGGALQDEA
jgi:hypothetical protein